MEIRLFGSLEVVVDGRTVPVSGQGERSLLAALACSAGVVPVDRLIDDLWGEDLPASSCSPSTAADAAPRHSPATRRADAFF